MVISSKAGRVIGIVRVPFKCFSGNIYACADAKIEIFAGETHELLYTVEGSYCQKPIFFPCFRLCYCPNIEYMILDKVNMKVGKIMNIHNGCFTECFSRTSKFGLELPIKV
jgi:hypothetical protein